MPPAASLAWRRHRKTMFEFISLTFGRLGGRGHWPSCCMVTV